MSQAVDNPFQSPGADAMFALSARTDRYPRLVAVVLIVDLISCAFVAIGVMITLLQWWSLYQTARDMAGPGIEGPQVVIHTWSVIGVAIRCCIVAFGVPAAILMLRRVRWGVIVGYAAVIATVAAMMVGLWDTVQSVPRVPEAQQTAYMIGRGIAQLLRLAYAGIYLSALMLFSRWIKLPSVAGQTAAPPGTAT